MDNLRKWRTEQMKQFGESLPGGMFVYRADETEGLIYVNSNCVKLFGCNDKKEFMEYVGGSFKGMVLPEDYDRTKNSISRQVDNSSEHTDHVCYRIRPKDGSIHWVDDLGRLIYDEVLGNVYIVVIQDVTDLMLEEGYSCGIDFAIQAYTSRRSGKEGIDADDVRWLLTECKNILKLDGIYVLEALPTNRGYTIAFESEVEPKYSREGMVVPCSYESYRTAIRNYNEERILQYKTEANGFPCTVMSYGAFRGKVYDGSLSFVDFTNLNREWTREEKESIKRLGRVMHNVLTFTRAEKVEKERHRQHERMLIALHDAKKAANAKSTFLFNMSHDIRTPMNAIVGYAHLTRNHLDDKDVALDYLSKLDLSITNMLQIINDVLEMAKIESGKMELELGPIDLYKEFRSLEVIFRSQMEEKGLDFHTNCDISSHNMVGDSACIKHVIQNLLSNALKYTHTGGSVFFDFKQTGLSSDGIADFVIKVKDTGIGMSDTFQEHIFEMFERERTAANSNIQGTGLGLAIAKRMANMMNGEIYCESEEGVGTEFTFVFSLPVNTVEMDKVAEEEIDISVFAGKRLLLAEDNAFNREITNEILCEAGFVVEFAENGLIALEKVKNHPSKYYDFILMDIQMPYMNGYQTTKEIRRLPDRKKAVIPIIALTANAFDEDKRKAYEQGMDAHLAKPINTNELYKLLYTLLK